MFCIEAGVDMAVNNLEDAEAAGTLLLTSRAS